MILDKEGGKEGRKEGRKEYEGYGISKLVHGC